MSVGRPAQCLRDAEARHPARVVFSSWVDKGKRGESGLGPAHLHELVARLTGLAFVSGTEEARLSRSEHTDRQSGTQAVWPYVYEWRIDASCNTNILFPHVFAHGAQDGLEFRSSDVRCSLLEQSERLLQSFGGPESLLLTSERGE